MGSVAQCAHLRTRTLLSTPSGRPRHANLISDSARETALTGARNLVIGEAAFASKTAPIPRRFARPTVACWRSQGATGAIIPG